MTDPDRDGREVLMRTESAPDANGRQPKAGDERWTIRLPLDNGDKLILFMDRACRDKLFGMLIAERVELGEES
jgi:hypothetical protein